MKNKKKVWLGIAAAILVLLLAVLLFGANYLVSFAIGRTTGTVNVAPASTLSDAARSAIAENWQKQKEQAAEWKAGADSKMLYTTSDDGLQLAAEVIVSDESSHRWVIAVHGYRGTHNYMDAPASYFGLQGYNALLPDLRGCGASEGDYIGMGWPDRRDMLKWIGWIIGEDPEAEIVLYGISMGGATVMMTSGEALPPQVKAVVEDCGYTTVWDIFEDELAYLFHLPSFPILHVASGISSFRAGYNFTEASSLKQVAKAEVPILFIHGSEDNFVHTDMIYKVYDACNTEKQMLVVDGAGHGNSYNHAPELYFDTIFTFLAPYVA